jgi:hypothetical protein
MEIEAQAVINAQKHMISDLQHQNLIMQLTIQKLQSELSEQMELTQCKTAERKAKAE